MGWFLTEMTFEKGGIGNRILGYLHIAVLEAAARGATMRVYVAHLLLAKNGDEIGAESMGFENEVGIVTMSNDRLDGLRRYHT